MSAMLLILLFFLGALLATIGGIIGIVDAFRVSTLWGILALFVPFALLVFCIKFWNQRKWARNSLVMSLLGLLAMMLPIPLGGLSLLAARNAADQDLEDLTVESDPNTAGDASADPSGTTSVPSETPDGDAELFEEAMLPGLPTAAEIARAELLPSTDPNERFNEIERERNDPYAFVPIPPPRKVPPPAPRTGGNANSPGATAGGNIPSPTNRPNGAAASPRPGGGRGPTSGQGSTPGGGTSGGGTPGQGNRPGGSQPAQPLPELPKPTVVASQVQISGVASVDGKTFVIIKAPNEPTSRYVEVGDRIANGTVLVKRIENRAGSAPVVVLEERGQEIALPVGSNVGPDQPAGDTSEDVAALPFLPSMQ